MRASLLKIKNVLGIEEREIKPGGLTVIEGDNGTGKTSILEALKALFQGGHDATLLRDGAEQGEIVLVLEDGTSITKTITPADSKTVVRDPKRGKVGATARYLNSLADLLSVNPVQFLTADPKRRLEWLLEVLPLEVTAEELAQAVGSVEGLSPDELQPGDQNALDAIARLRKRIYALRTGVNSVAEDKRRWVRETNEHLPPESDVNPAERVHRLRAELEGLQSDLGAVKTGNATALAERKNTLYAEFCTKRDGLKAEADRKIAAIQAQLNTDVEVARTAYNESVEQATQEAASGLQDATAVLNARIQALSGEIVRAEEQAVAYERAKSLRSLVDRTRKEAEEREAESERMTAAIENLDQLKARFLEDLPIAGLTVEDGRVLLDGIPFDRVNTARKVSVALQIAAMRAQDLKLICLDDAEHLAPKTFAAFEKAAAQMAEKGYQFVVSRVAEGPLQVKTA